MPQQCMDKCAQLTFRISRPFFGGLIPSLGCRHSFALTWSTAELVSRAPHVRIWLAILLLSAAADDRVGGVEFNTRCIMPETYNRSCERKLHGVCCKKTMLTLLYLLLVWTTLVVNALLIGVRFLSSWVVASQSCKQRIKNFKNVTRCRG